MLWTTMRLYTAKDAVGFYAYLKLSRAITG